MKKGFTFLLAIVCVIAFCMVPAAASTIDAADTVDDDLSISALEIPVYGPKSSTTGTIIHGQMNSYSYAVQPGDSEMDIQLSWGSTSNNLALMFTSPSGVIYGAYDDYYDSSTPNARFGIHIESTVGAMPHGTWIFDVLGKSVTGTETYTLIINSH